MVRMLATTDGLLAIHHLGRGTARFVALHGFTLTGESFAGLARHVPGAVVAPDLPGHGATRLESIDLETTLRALGELLTDVDVPPVLVGYSQGGRLAAQLAARSGGSIAGLVMVSATLGIDDRSRPERRTSDEELARWIEEVGVERFLDHWLAQPLTGSADIAAAAAAADRSLRAQNTAAGLAAALRGLGQGALPRVAPSAITVPSLWLAGERDHGYVERMQDEASHTGGRFDRIPGVGHNVIRDAGSAVAATIADWVSGIHS